MNDDTTHKRTNTWIDDQSAKRTRFYLDEADEFLVDRQTIRTVLIRLFGYRFEGRSGLDVLDLGCGSGFLTAGIHDVYPDNSFTLLDGSREMLDQAREHFPGNNFRFVRSSFEEYLQAPMERFDFICSSNAIHHLALTDKLRLYQRIFDALSPGGMFLNIDVVLPPSDLCEEWQFNLWRDWMRERQHQKGSDNAGRYDALPQGYKQKEENQPSGLGEQMSALREVGYQNVDCYYKHSIFALFGGTK